MNLPSYACTQASGHGILRPTLRHTPLLPLSIPSCRQAHGRTRRLGSATHNVRWQQPWGALARIAPGLAVYMRSQRVTRVQQRQVRCAAAARAPLLAGGGAAVPCTPQHHLYVVQGPRGQGLGQLFNTRGGNEGHMRGGRNSREVEDQGGEDCSVAEGEGRAGAWPATQLEREGGKEENRVDQDTTDYRDWFGGGGAGTWPAAW